MDDLGSGSGQNKAMHFEKEDLARLTEFSVLKELKDNLDALALFGQILQKKRLEMRSYIVDEDSNSSEMFFFTLRESFH